MSNDFETEMADTSKFKIDVLRNDNYFMWSRKMKLILRAKGVWNIVNGVETTPEESSTSEMSRFERKHDIALTNLVLSIDDSCVGSVIEMIDAKEV